MQKLSCAKKALPNLKDILPLANASYKTKSKCTESAQNIPNFKKKEKTKQTKPQNKSSQNNKTPSNNNNKQIRAIEPRVLCFLSSKLVIACI